MKTAGGAIRRPFSCNAQNTVMPVPPGPTPKSRHPSESWDPDRETRWSRMRAYPADSPAWPCTRIAESPLVTLGPSFRWDDGVWGQGEIYPTPHRSRAPAPWRGSRCFNARAFFPEARSAIRDRRLERPSAAIAQSIPDLQPACAGLRPGEILKRDERDRIHRSLGPRRKAPAKQTHIHPGGRARQPCGTANSANAVATCS